MNPVPVDKAGVCPECGTLRGVREAVALRWSDWRRWFWPVLGVLWVVGLVAWENRDFLSRPTSYGSSVVTTMPGCTVPRGLGVSVGDLRRIAHSGTGDSLARQVLENEGYWYSPHLEERGNLAIVSSPPNGSVGRAWSIGWPWRWAVRSVAETYKDADARTGKMEGPDWYPARWRFQMLGGMWAAFPAGGWENFSFDVQPLIVILMLGWVVGALVCGVARVMRVEGGKRRRLGRWVRWSVVCGCVLLGLTTFERSERVQSPVIWEPVPTGLTRSRVAALIGTPTADQVVATELLKVAHVWKDEERVDWSWSLPVEWRAVYRGRAVQVPFMAFGEVESDDPVGVPRPGVWHWGWMAGGVWGHSEDGKRAKTVQVWLDQMLWWMAPVWLLCGVMPGVVRWWRNGAARRRVKRGLCGACGYQLGPGTETTTQGSTPG